ncbi:nitrogen fixation protein NifM [Kosakonia sacchari]|uniref:nitrogen fixation protein NifM n=1 Tax=Kosakonia sacchari TaxID=1158459 RepID=UPI0015859C1F|nr:nitrogen fixation protein NifM [Kosakonia sacchari]NUL35146.1 nitrogen fixation protein NifM [Kosakonia sacchari]
MMAWERFARRRLALTRWHCEPENIPAAQQPAFDRAWARQRQLELAVVAMTRDATIPDDLHHAVATALAAQLDESPFSPAERQAVIAHHARLETQFAEVASKAPVPDEASVLRWYQQHQAQFMRPEQRLTSHLLLTTEQNHAGIRKQITRFYQQIRDNRAAFPRLAARHSHCPSALEGGRLGWVSRGLLFAELENALFALQTDEVSQPVETALGWHLLWCEQIRQPALMAKADALAKAREYLFRQSQQQWQRQWLAALLQAS